jgi:hypothetical protein
MLHESGGKRKGLTALTGKQCREGEAIQFSLLHVAYC